MAGSIEARAAISRKVVRSYPCAAKSSCAALRMAACVRCDLAVLAGRSDIGGKCQQLLTNATAFYMSTAVDLLGMTRGHRMHLMRPEPAAAVLSLRAMKTIASASGPIGPAQHALMQGAQKVILGIEAD